jgi:hypothetical protein
MVLVSNSKSQFANLMEKGLPVVRELVSMGQLLGNGMRMCSRRDSICRIAMIPTSLAHHSHQVVNVSRKRLVVVHRSIYLGAEINLDHRKCQAPQIVVEDGRVHLPVTLADRTLLLLGAEMTTTCLRGR